MSAINVNGNGNRGITDPNGNGLLVTYDQLNRVTTTTTPNPLHQTTYYFDDNNDNRTHDMELLHRAEALDERARTAYNQRNAALRGAKPGFESDDKALDSYLGKSEAQPRTAETAARTPPGTDRAGRDATKEVNR